MDGQLKELKVSNDAMNDPQELRRRIEDEGYLFFKRLQDPDRLLDLRRQILDVIQEGGWLVPGTDPVDGIADPSKACTEGDVGYTDVYHEVYKLQAFHESGHWREVLDTLEKLTDKPVLPHPQKIARLWFPQYTDHTTPIHQDFVHFQGHFETYTCWAPVGDCSIELGGLALLPGSHKVNHVMDHHFSLGAGALQIYTDDIDGEWHSTNYEIGDTLIFLALTVHQALPNLTDDRLRISLDNRYHTIGDPICDEVIRPHLWRFNSLSWDEVYQDWESDDLKYYWKDLIDTPETPVIPKDQGYSEHGFAEALSLAKTGDREAIIHLERVIKNDPASEMGQEPREKRYKHTFEGTRAYASCPDS